jgi:SOS response regulatory protein OraA/RecX
MDASREPAPTVARLSIPDRPDQIDWREVYTEKGELAGIFHVSSLIRMDIGAGSVLTPEVFTELRITELRRAARDRALGYLATRDRTAAEVARYLGKKPQPGFEKAVVRAVVEELREEGLLNDRVLAARLADQAAARAVRGESRRMVFGRMRRRGISARDAREALGEHPVDEWPGALALARRKLAEMDRKAERAGGQAGDKVTSPRLHAEAYRRSRRRRDALAGYLARKGYTSATIRKVVVELLGDPVED